MAELLDVVILVALPASGKSEVRKYLAGLSPEQCRSEFHLGPTVQLDDYPYVHLFRRIDQELARRGREGIFFRAMDQPFRNPLDWGTLIELLNEDFDRLLTRRTLAATAAAELLFERIDYARDRVGGGRPLAGLGSDLRSDLARAIEREACDLQRDLNAGIPESLDGRTVVIEFARGGPDGATMPLPAPLGYGYSFSRLSPAILEKAAVLYVWVAPAESRRKNEERTDPNDPGSILHHGVPLEVMLEDYGCDDVDFLLARSSRPDTVTVEAHGRKYPLPLVRFDNRVDKTSFVRKDRSAWREEEVRALHDGLKGALSRLAQAYRG